MNLRPRRLAVAAVLPLFAAGALGACSEEPEDEPLEEGPIEEPLEDEPLGEEPTDGAEIDEEIPDNAADILDEPADFTGEEVTVEGEVSEQIDERTFRIAGDGADEGLLVISAAGDTQLSTDDETEIGPQDMVEVTGTVREVAEDTFEDDFGFAWEDAFADWEGEPAIAAESIEVMTGQAEQ